MSADDALKSGAGECASDSSIHQTPEETAALLHSLSAEVLHEIAHTLNFLHYLDGQVLHAVATPEMLGFVRKEISRIEGLARNLRQFKLPLAPLSEVSLAACIEQAVANMRSTASARGIQLAITGDAALTAQAHPLFFTLALQNLILQSVESSPAGDTVRIDTYPVNASGPIRIEISAGGSPISAEQRVHLFNLWTMGSLELPALRRVIAFRLLRHIGWTVRYEYVESRNIFQVSALPHDNGSECVYLSSMIR